MIIGPLNIRADDGQGWVLAVERNPLLPPPDTFTWTHTFSIDKDGQVEMDGSLTISGRHVETMDDWGHYRVRRPTLLNYMLGIWSDVRGPALVLRCNSTPESFFLQLIDDATGQECARIGKDATIHCRSIKTEDGVTGVYRIGPAVVTLECGRIMSVEGIDPIRPMKP